MMKVDIFGAGMGGLTTAIALEQKGIRTRVFEQA
jgi:2-polyprenyl-6-methoxyphenol hydroxylase-like FAD-dependent oxidoreductase